MKMELSDLKKFPRYKTNLTYAEDPLRVFSYNTLVAQKYPKKEFLVIRPGYASGEDKATPTTTRHINYAAKEWGLVTIPSNFITREQSISRSPWNYCEEVK